MHLSNSADHITVLEDVTRATDNSRERNKLQQKLVAGDRFGAKRAQMSSITWAQALTFRGEKEVRVTQRERFLSNHSQLFYELTPNYPNTYQTTPNLPWV